MKINFSNHSLLKIEILKKHGIEISKKFIEGIISSPKKLKQVIKTG